MKLQKIVTIAVVFLVSVFIITQASYAVKPGQVKGKPGQLISAEVMKGKLQEAGVARPDIAANDAAVAILIRWKAGELGEADAMVELQDMGLKNIPGLFANLGGFTGDGHVGDTFAFGLINQLTEGTLDEAGVRSLVGELQQAEKRTPEGGINGFVERARAAGISDESLGRALMLLATPQVVAEGADAFSTLASNPNVKTFGFPASFAEEHGQELVYAIDTVLKPQQKIPVIITHPGEVLNITDPTLLARIESQEIYVIEVAPRSPADLQLNEAFKKNNFVALEQTIGDLRTANENKKIFK